MSALCSRAREDMSSQEVLYVGQAFGENGSSNAWERTRRHETLQRVYEEHFEGWDIFVSAFEIVSCERTNIDHIEDSEEGSPIGVLDEGEAFWDRSKRRPSRAAVSLVEHALIAYFNPPYNKYLTRWQPSEPTGDMRLMQRAGLRLLRVHLNGHGTLARFYSKEARSATRSHLVFHDIPPHPRRPALRGIGAERISDWQAKILQLADPARVIEEGEVSDIVLQSFGEKAPAVRKPPEVDLPEHAYTDEERIKGFELLRDKVFEYEGPDFSPATGEFSVGVGADGGRVRSQAISEQGAPRHGVIMGPPGSGRTNALTVAMLGYISSGLFVPWLADGGGRHLEQLRAWHRNLDWIAPNQEEMLAMLTAALNIAEFRAKDGSYAAITRGKPGILIAIDDAHLAFSTSKRITYLCERLSELGPTAGIAIIVVVPDGNVARFGGSHKMRSNLGKKNLQVLGIVDGDVLFEEFR
ncbi:hypothetical protein FXF53_28780 [Micromonospora sp. WP24]|nr:hypothetical protein FXF53_28780 [Micromonospora sp. WP24]